VSYAVHPEKAPELFVRLSDQGKLHQEDATKEEQDKNEVLQKIILPHIRGWVRIEGSNLDATDLSIRRLASAIRRQSTTANSCNGRS
jgi:hypothetical protein